MAKLVRLDDGTPAIALSETELEAFAERPRELELASARHGGGGEAERGLGFYQRQPPVASIREGRCELSARSWAPQPA